VFSLELLGQQKEAEQKSESAPEQTVEKSAQLKSPGKRRSQAKDKKKLPRS
jgi:hypothetical protein